MIQKFDLHIINRLKKLEMPLARSAIFIIYFWFGLLKLLGVSPAVALVEELFLETTRFVSFSTFYLFFSIFEMTIGFLFLVRGWERFVIFLLGIHLFVTVLPLIFLPQVTWQGFFIPTLEGQYIIKNILIAAVAVVVGSKLVPILKTNL